MGIAMPWRPWMGNAVKAMDGPGVALADATRRAFENRHNISLARRPAEAPTRPADSKPPLPS